MAPSVTDTTPASPTDRLRFSLQAAFSALLTACVLLAYLRGYGPEVAARCAVALLVAAAVGAGIGWVDGSLVDPMFWSCMGAIVASLAVTGVDVYHWSSHYIWPLLYSVTGAVVATSAAGRLLRRAVVGALTAAAIMGLYVVVVFGRQPELAAEWLCALLAGAILALWVDVSWWLEHRFRIPRHVLSAAMVLATVAGHWGSTQWLEPLLGRPFP